MRLRVFVNQSIKDLGKSQRFIYLVRDVNVFVRSLVSTIVQSIGVSVTDGCFASVDDYSVPLDELVCDILREDDCLNIDHVESIIQSSTDAIGEIQPAMVWTPITRDPVAEEWICYKTRETDYLTGEEFCSKDFKVAQVLWVDSKLRKNPIFVVRQGLDGQGAFDTFELSDISELHCCTAEESTTVQEVKPNRRMEKVKAALRRQIEWYLSPGNLKSDVYLINAITENSFSLPVEFFSSFPRISDITDDLEILTAAVSSSKRLRLNSGQILVPPEIVLEAKKLQLLDLL